jgi:predicted lactoylglutathione lyase
MLLGRQVFAAMSPKPVANTATVAGVLNCLRLDSREEIDRIMEAALAAGATEPRPQREQQGTYGRAFEDPDGHIWELLWIEGE